MPTPTHQEVFENEYANIIIDTREKEFGSKKKKTSMFVKAAADDTLIPYEGPLPVGDYLLSNGDLYEKKTVQEFVRKAMNDWQGFINQIKMLKKAPEVEPAIKRVFYLIQGSEYVIKLGDLSFDYYYGVLNSLVLDFGLNIIRTSSADGTIMHFANQIDKSKNVMPIYHSFRNKKGLGTKSLSFQQRFLLEGFSGWGGKRVCEILKRFKTPALIFQGLMYPDHFSIFNNEKQCEESFMDIITSIKGISEKQVREKSNLLWTEYTED